MPRPSLSPNSEDEKDALAKYSQEAEVLSANCRLGEQLFLLRPKERWIDRSGEQ